jgi:thiol:disulfide interchange protein DsbG
LPAILAALVLSACNDGGDKAAGTPAGAAPAASSAAAVGNLYEAASKGTGFTVGNMMAVRQIYVFFDPQCPHCGHLWEAAKPLANQVKMVWMPVGFIGAKSTPQGAALLAASDPSAAMSAHEQSLLAQQGGLIPPADLPADLLEKVKANTKLWSQLGGESVPFVVFKAPGTGEPGKFAGSLDTEGLKKLLGI